MKMIKRGLQIFFFVIVITLLLFMGCMHFYPEETASIVGFRSYVVLTDSMEPKIPTNSLVITKVIDRDETLHLQKGDIITFKANRFGENILLTHRFHKLEKNSEGVTCYRTNAEGKSELDMYETKRSDIIGTYVFHIAYVGKIILFLQSKFGFLLYAELILIWLVNKLVKTKWEEREKKEQENVVHQQEDIERAQITEKHEVLQKTVDEKEAVYLDDVCLIREEEHFIAHALIHNDTKEAIQKIKVEIIFFREEVLIARYATFVANEVKIEPGKTHQFCFKTYLYKGLTSCSIKIIK